MSQSRVVGCHASVVTMGGQQRRLAVSGTLLAPSPLAVLFASLPGRFYHLFRNTKALIHNLWRKYLRNYIVFVEQDESKGKSKVQPRPNASRKSWWLYAGGCSMESWLCLFLPHCWRGSGGEQVSCTPIFPCIELYATRARYRINYFEDILMIIWWEMWLQFILYLTWEMWQNFILVLHRCIPYNIGKCIYYMKNSEYSETRYLC